VNDTHLLSQARYREEKSAEQTANEGCFFTLFDIFFAFGFAITHSNRIFSLFEVKKDAEYCQKDSACRHSCRIEGDWPNVVHTRALKDECESPNCRGSK
jgi:hypothetical protein